MSSPASVSPSGVYSTQNVDQVTTQQTGFRPIAIKVEHLWVQKGGGLLNPKKSILQDINFEIRPGSFVAVVGPNGAGKTTTFKALVGERPTYGRVLISRENGTSQQWEDMYANPDYWLQLIGYVPVDNVLHDDLTVRQALMHVGRLRLPGESDDMIYRKINERLQDLGFANDDERLDRLVRSLSSGERKKANVVAELLTDPPLLMLDEPTSNLDPNAERDLMDKLKSISGEQRSGQGPTILLITHTLESLDRCSSIVFIANSKLLKDGEPDEVFQWLEHNISTEHGATIPDSSNPFEHWAEIFEVHKTGEAGRRKPVDPKPLTTPVLNIRRQKPQSTFSHQFRILLSRYFLSRYNDLGGISAMLIAAFIAGFLLLIAPSSVFLETNDASIARQTVVLCVILVVIVGVFNSHREISKEFRIYIHERAKGLDPSAYVLSKVVWLSVVIGLFGGLIILSLMGFPISRTLVLIFGIILLLVGAVGTFSATGAIAQLSTAQKLARIGQLSIISLPLIAAALIQFQNKRLPVDHLSATTVELSIIVTFILTSIAALTVGLMASAVVGGNNDRATQLSIGLIIANVILAFSVLIVTAQRFRAFFDFLKPFTATHWGYRGIASSLSIYCWAGTYRMDEYNSLGHLIAVLLYIVLHIVVAVGLAILFLRLQETWITRGQVGRQLLREGSTWVLVGSAALLLSWGVFLTDQSKSFFDLTFYDRMLGSRRYASIIDIQSPSLAQQGTAYLSTSACLLQNDEGSEEDTFEDEESEGDVTMTR